MYRNLPTSDPSLLRLAAPAEGVGAGPGRAKAQRKKTSRLSAAIIRILAGHRARHPHLPEQEPTTAEPTMASEPQVEWALRLMS